MNSEHPNIAVLQQYSPANIPCSIGILTKGAIVFWRIQDWEIKEVGDTATVNTAIISKPNIQ